MAAHAQLASTAAGVASGSTERGHDGGDSASDPASQLLRHADSRAADTVVPLVLHLPTQVATQMLRTAPRPQTGLIPTQNGWIVYTVRSHVREHVDLLRRLSPKCHMVELRPTLEMLVEGFQAESTQLAAAANLVPGVTTKLHPPRPLGISPDLRTVLEISGHLRRS